MSTALIVGLVVVVLVVIAVAAWVMNSRRREREALREHFGPEYERAVDQYGTEHDAADALAARKERVQQLHLRPLSAEQSATYAAEWRAIQAQFVDDPNEAIARADQVVIDVMQHRGYPMTDFEQRAADISVDHPDVVEHYRAAHSLAERAAHADAGTENAHELSTEDMRQALVHYRYLFDELIESVEVRA
jgi:hypothetical protein